MSEMSLLHPADVTGARLRREAKHLAKTCKEPRERAFWAAMSTFDPSIYGSVTERLDAFLAMVTEHLGGDPAQAPAVVAEAVSANEKRRE